MLEVLTIESHRGPESVMHQKGRENVVLGVYSEVNVGGTIALEEESEVASNEPIECENECADVSG